MYIEPARTPWDPSGWSLETDLAPALWLKEASEDAWGRWENRRPRGVSRVGDVTTYLYPRYLSISHEAIRRSEDPSGSDPGRYEYLSDGVSSRLVSVLRHQTSAANTCWAIHWLGYGDLEPSLLAHPSIQMPARDCILARGSFDWIEEPPVGERTWGLPPYSPEYWWPTDGAWLVHSDTDLDATYIGCSEAAAEELLALGLDGLEAVSAETPTIGH